MTRPQPAPTVITLQTIADHAKVSATTVSLALRNHPKISAATRARVSGLARELGYRASPLVSAHLSYLRTLRPRATGQCLAFVCNRSLAEFQADTRTPLYKYFLGARARAHELGFELVPFNLFDHGMSGRRLSQILVARGIVGVVIAPLSEGAGRSDVALDWDQFAFVTIEHTFVSPRLHNVCHDEFSTISRIIQRLLDVGFARIGIAMAAQMDEHVNHLWLAGYQTFQALSPAARRLPHYITPRWNREEFIAWYRRCKPDAIITITPDVVNWLSESGVHVPGDVSCATLYWKPDRAFLSGFYQNHEAMAAAAVDLLTAQLCRNERGVPVSEKTVLIQAEWRDGDTLRPAQRERATRAAPPVGTG